MFNPTQNTIRKEKKRIIKRRMGVMIEVL